MTIIHAVVAGLTLTLLAVQPALADAAVRASSAGWQRAELFAALTGMAGASHTLTEQTAPGALAKIPDGAKRLADQTKRLDAGDRIWSLATEGVTIFMAGTEDHIHTIGIYAPVVSFSPAQGEAFKTFNAQLFERLFPDWREGRTWLVDSLGRTWQIIAKNWGTRDPKVMATFVERHVQGPVALSSTGVPPDIQIYRLTVKPACEIDVMQPDLFQRWVC